MNFNVESSKLFELVASALEAEFANEVDAFDGIGTREEIAMAHEQVCLLRDQVRQYEMNHRAAELKPCINHQMIVDRIVYAYRERHQVEYVHRVCGYKTLFIMYLLCKLISPISRSWWEKQFLERLPSYLERTDFFKGSNCKYRLDVLLDQMPQDGVLPMEVERLIPAPKPDYPLLYPVQVFQGCLFAINQTNYGCQQFFDEVNNSTFQKAG